MPYSDYEPLLPFARNLDTAKPVPEAEAGRYRGILPDGLLEFWVRHGNNIVFGDGYMQMCDPAVFAPIIRDWFEGDPEFEYSKLPVFARSSIGNLYLCDGSLEAYAIYAQLGEFAHGPYVPPPTGECHLDFFLAHQLKLGTVTPRYIDEYDTHTEAVAKHGPLAPGEMFTWVPALQIAKEGNRIEKVDAEVQLAILQELGPLKYITMNFTEDGLYLGTEFKRYIGPQG